MSTLDQLLLNTETHDEFLRRLMSSLVQATRKSNELPKGIEHNYGTTYEDFRQAREEANDEAGKLIVDILGYCESTNPTPKAPNKRSFSMSDDLADPYFYDQIVETISSLLDQADIALDKKKPIISSLRVDKEKIIMENVKDITKPQLAFLGDIDNSRRTIFKPKMLQYNHEKYHQKVPFSESDKIKVVIDAETSHELHSYTHPYEYELQNLQFPDFIFNEKKTQKPTNSNHFFYIDTLEKLNKMIDELSNVQEIAFDLEHHSVRSFQGLTCLMQISSRTNDYIIDTLVLRLELYRLGKIFANPNIIKVFHGGERDILWLQRDLGLYVVNAFDTFIAARVLQFPTLSLAHLCRHYYGLVIDKKYQLADWRARPLPEEMLEYARKDTHYLLYIYDRMKVDLTSRGGREAISDVLYASKKVCMGKYDKPGYDPVGFRALFAKFGTSKTLLKLEELTDNMDIVLRNLWEWRDRKARQEDESCEYIMSNSELLRIGTHLPGDLNELKKVCAPISSYVEANAEEVLSIVNGTYNRNLAKDSYLGDGDFEDESEFEFLNKINASYTYQGNTSESAKLNTVYSFTPSVVIMPQELRKVLATKSTTVVDKSIINDAEKIFRFANWKVNQNPESTMLNLSNIPSQNLISEENRIKMSNSLKNLVTMIEKDVEFEAQLESLVSKNEEEEEESKEKTNFTAEENGGMILELPKSYEEIYQLSNRNRKKNRDKKKNKESDNVEDDGESGATQFQSSITMDEDDDDEDFDFNKEFPHEANAKQNDTSVQSTLNFAKDIGWIKSNEDADKLEESYNNVLAYQQNIDRDSLPGSSNDNLSASINSTQSSLSLSTSSLNIGSSQSFKNRNKKDSFKRDTGSSIPSNTKVSNSFNGNSSIKKNPYHSNTSANSSAAPPVNKSFDMSKYTSTSMGVLGSKTSTSTSSVRNSNNNKSGGFKGNGKRQTSGNNAYANIK